MSSISAAGRFTRGLLCCLALSACVIFPLACASDGVKEAAKMGEYKKMMDAQKLKSDLAAEEAALKKLPDPTAESYERMGDGYLRQGNLDKAFINYTKGLNLDPKSVRLRYKMAGLFLTRGLATDAEQGYLSIIKDHPDYAPAYEGLGRAYFAAGNMEKAEESFRQALKINPRSWQAENHIGIVKDRLKKHDEAIGHYRAAIAIKPDSGLLYNNLGMSYYLKDDSEKAVLAFNEALAKGEAGEKVSNNLAQAYVSLKRYDEALEVWRKAHGETEAYLKVGNLYLKEKKYGKAAEAFEKAVDSSPKYNQEAVDKLRQVKRQMRDKDSANPDSGAGSITIKPLSVTGLKME